MEIVVLTVLSTLLLVAVLIDHGLNGMVRPRPIRVAARRGKAECPEDAAHPGREI